MVEWLQITLIAVAAVLGALFLIVILKRCCCRNKTCGNLDVLDLDRAQNLYNGVARLHQVSPHQQDHLDHPGGRKLLSNNNYAGRFQRGLSKKSAFSWADHPSLVTDAVENGWSQFAFMNFVTLVPPPASVKFARAFLAGCGDSGNVPRVEIGWEVSEGSTNFMQKIRLKKNWGEGNPRFLQSIWEEDGNWIEV